MYGGHGVPQGREFGSFGYYLLTDLKCYGSVHGQCIANRLSIDFFIFNKKQTMFFFEISKIDGKVRSVQTKRDSLAKCFTQYANYIMWTHFLMSCLPRN